MGDQRVNTEKGVVKEWTENQVGDQRVHIERGVVKKWTENQVGDQRVNTEQEVITEVNTELDGLSESEHRTKSDQGVKKKNKGDEQRDS